MIRSARVPKIAAGDDELLAECEALAIGRCLSERGFDDHTPQLHRDGVTTVLQQLNMLRSASRIANDPLLAARVGLALHPTSYGIAGLALLSSASLRDALRIVSEYGALLCLKVRIDLELGADEVRLTLNNCFDLPPGLLQLCSQLEVAKLCTLLRDLSGGRVRHVELASPPELRPQLETLLGTSVRCGAGAGSVSFDGALLDAGLLQADAATHQSSLRSCNELISTLRRCDELRRRVRGMVISANGSIPTLSQVASQLFLSTRTLRRRLEDAQTSYQEIVGETRRALAVGYLTHTTLSTEAISEILGYSDTANFRQAFKRWTGESPQQYRRLARGSAAALNGYGFRQLSTC